MKREPGEAEVTELIDVSNIDTGFEDEAPVAHEDSNLPGELLQGPGESHGPATASIKDRFSAFFIDAAILYGIYWVLLPVFRSVTFGEAIGPIPVRGTEGLIFHGLFFLIALLYFLIPELTFAASAGKLLCHLTIRTTYGEYPSFTAVLLRNLVRPVDIILFIFFVMFMVFEWNPWHRRLGDFIGGTVVIRKLERSPRQFALSIDIIPTASLRFLAFIIDFALVALFTAGIFLLLSPEDQLSSMLIVVFAPFALLCFFVIPEYITKTSPGKWIYGLAVCHEDGTAVSLASSVVRNLWRVFDMNPIGFITCLFSVRRQRFGDSAAGTVVVKTPRGWRGLLGLVAVIAVSLLTLYGGFQKRDNALSGDFQINFLPSADISPLRFGVHKKVKTNLMTTNFHFAAGDATDTRTPATFEAGETLFVIFDVISYAKDSDLVWLQEDLSIRYPDDSVGLKIENVNDFHQAVQNEGPIRFENNVTLPQDAKPGRYTVNITIRDKLAKQELKEQRYFYVNPPPSASPPPAPPAPQAPDIEEEFEKSQDKPPALPPVNKNSPDSGDVENFN